MIKCILFDCDGNLVDSEYLCNLGLEIMLRDFDVESSAKEMMERFRGEKLASILQSIESEHHIKLKGNFVSSWGAGLISFAHAIYLDKDDNV